jgi:hypothetical protein
VRRFILFHKKRHPIDMGAPEIRAFLACLVTQRNVAAPTWMPPACSVPSRQLPKKPASPNASVVIPSGSAQPTFRYSFATHLLSFISNPKSAI